MDCMSVRPYLLSSLVTILTYVVSAFTIDAIVPLASLTEFWITAVAVAVTAVAAFLGGLVAAYSL